MGSWLLTGSIPSLVLLSGWCLIGATHRGQPWTLSLRLPHMRDGLSALRMAVLCPFRRSSMGRYVHRESATSGKAGGLKKVEPLKADRCGEPLKAVRL
jgi:hypothetical protein